MLYLASNIKLIRLISGLSQSDFGGKFDATKAMIVSYERGKANPDELFISRLAKFAGISEEDLKNRKLAEENVKLEKGDLKEPENSKTVTLNTSKEQQLKDILQNKAMLKTLLHELAALKAKAEGRPVTDVLMELNEKSMQNLIDLTRQ